MRTSEFDFELPPELVAQHPVEPRDAARLMVVDRASGSWLHRRFSDLPDLLRAGDVLVRNNSRVIPARLIGRRCSTGGFWEGLFLQARADGTWRILAKTRGRPTPEEWFETDSGLRLQLLMNHDGGEWVVMPNDVEDAFEALERHGRVPLPPYIRKGRDEPADRLRYQTEFARVPGSVAAPTAGLHFTEQLLQKVTQRSVEIVDLTLHVGVGTFRPIDAGMIGDHVMHAEWAELSEAAARAIQTARECGGRIVAVGTTSARTLETAVARGSGRLMPFRGETSIYLKPGHQFGGLDALVTNFHLPRSSLLVLLCAFAGKDLTLAAYQEAIRERYRFYSYGDAMVVF